MDAFNELRDLLDGGDDDGGAAAADGASAEDPAPSGEANFDDELGDLLGSSSDEDGDGEGEDDGEDAGGGANFADELGDLLGSSSDESDGPDTEEALTGEYTWTIENFSKVKQLKLYSPVFQSGQYNWCAPRAACSR